MEVEIGGRGIIGVVDGVEDMVDMAGTDMITGPRSALAMDSLVAAEIKNDSNLIDIRPTVFLF